MKYPFASAALVVALLASTGCSEPASTVESAEAAAFEGTDCRQLGIELGEQLDAKMTEIIEGPEVVDGETQAVRAGDWQIVIAGALNDRLRSLELRDECEASTMLAVAETQFSDEMRANVGSILYDAGAASTSSWDYHDWREEALQALSVIDDE